MDCNTKLNRVQKMVTKEQWEKLISNGKNRDKDHAPVVKFFNPRGAQTWLFNEFDVVDDGADIFAFGLCDLGMGCAELGTQSIQEMVDIGYLERDLHFKAKGPMSIYSAEAREKGRICS